MGSSEPLSWEDKGEHDDAEKCQKIHPLPNEAKILEIPKEDRTIGVLTSWLYWDYFRSGAGKKCQKIHPLPNEAKILEIPKEDRTIGVLTSWLYWDYFRSGAHPLMITGMVE